MNELIQFISENAGKLLEQTVEHIGLTVISLLLSVLLAVPAGILIARRPKLASGFLGVAGVLQTIPSIALLGFLIPVLGIGVKPAIFALFLYALLPILRNTFTGISEVPKSVVEAARGMGMTSSQILQKVELPLSLPVIFAGIRTATVINVGVATLAAYIGAGGLGEFIFGGIALNNSTMIIAGALPAALLAILLDQLLAFLQRMPARRMARAGSIGVISLLLLSSSFIIPRYFAPGIRAGFDTEFYGRKDGYPALQDRYGVVFNTVFLNAALMYEAIRADEVDIIAGYATDGRIKAYDLKVLTDDQHAFPPYYCTPVIRQEIIDQYPEVEMALNLLANQLDDATMTELNYQVDFEKKTPEAVAIEFLKSVDLWKPDRKQGGQVLRIGSKIFTEQYILTALFGQLINGYTDLDVDYKNGLGGTKICFDALKAGELDIYPEYTGTGFMVILAPTEAEIEANIANPDAVYNYVSDAFEKEYSVRWLEPLGFNNTYALMAKRSIAERKGWVSVGDLVEKE